MRFEINFAFCVLVALTGSSQTRGHSSASPPVLSPAGTSSASPDPTEDPQRTHSGDGTASITKTTWTVHSETVTMAGYETHSAVATSQHMSVPVIMTPSAATDSLSSVPTPRSATSPQHLSTADGRAMLTTHPFTAFSSQPAHTALDTSSAAYASTIQPKSKSPTVAATQPTTARHPVTSAPAVRGPAGPAHQEVPSELNVGDEDLKGPRYRSSSPLDPLLAGLLSVFIVTTAIVFVILFLKFRQRTNHPEFHRLQDLPMDDLMEDTPLSRYTY